MPASLLLLPAPAYAQIGDLLCDVWWMLQGDLGRGLATLAVAALGIGAMLGKVSWGMAIMVAVGVAVLFGANDINFSLTGYKCL